MKVQGQILEQLAQAAAQAISQGQQLKSGAEQAIKDLLKQKLSELDLVTRDEFDQQQQLLHSCEQRLHELQARLQQLEQR